MMTNQELSCCLYVVKRVFLLYIYIYIIRICGHKMEHRLQGVFFGAKRRKKGVVSRKETKKRKENNDLYFFLQKKHFFQKKS